jgi:hypothetical protein
MFRSVYSVSLCCSVYCLCVNVYFTTTTGCQPNCSEIYVYHITYDRLECQRGEPSPLWPFESQFVCYVTAVFGSCCSEVLFEMRLISTNEDYADRHFLHGFCNGTGRLLQRSTGEDQRIYFEAQFSVYTEFWEWLVPSHVGARNVCKYGLETMVFSMQGRGPTYMCAQNLHEVWYCVDAVTGGVSRCWLLTDSLQRE